jgi:hypothetical protein
MSKLKSRKFWIAVAAFLGSVGASIAGLCVNVPAITITGLICSILSAAIYNAAEAYVDGERIETESIQRVLGTDSETDS